VAADPVLAKRAQVARWVQLGQRTGYLALMVAVVLFVIGFLTGFPGGLATAVFLALIMACIVLPPAMVFGYGVKAAERHEAELRGERPPSRH
jgi:hypothetical protein